MYSKRNPRYSTAATLTLSPSHVTTAHPTHIDQRNVISLVVTAHGRLPIVPPELLVQPPSPYFNVQTEFSLLRLLIAAFTLPPDHTPRTQYPLFERCDIFTQRTILKYIQITHLGLYYRIYPLICANAVVNTLFTAYFSPLRHAAQYFLRTYNRTTHFVPNALILPQLFQQLTSATLVLDWFFRSNQTAPQIQPYSEWRADRNRLTHDHDSTAGCSQC